MKKLIIIFIIFIFVAVSILLLMSSERTLPTEIKNFADCVNAGNPVMESYPRQCRNGETLYVEDIGNELEKASVIQIGNPRPNQVIKTPLIIEGFARGTWFFEGDFPVILTDWDGKIIAEGYATAQTSWMKEDFVEFKGSLDFEKPENIGDFSKRGSLILKKDNPSGLSENDDALEIPILFE
ncbi:MAG: Gmad2 immunoglobulin-like domain-containing protein [Candidatus Marinimicrobia bacterium]|nr:Gmad2 immunoglobulin-like domain-containing protein [Candidatus Neomarinimicrobiota bacterium]